jgi:hypothetical protein
MPRRLEGREVTPGGTHGFSFSRPMSGPRHEGRLVRDPLEKKRGERGAPRGPRAASARGKGKGGMPPHTRTVPRAPRAGDALVPGLALRLGASLKRSRADPPPWRRDGRGRRQGRAAHPDAPETGRRRTLRAPGLCRPGLSAASTQKEAPRLPAPRLSRATARLGFGPFEPKPSSRDAAPRPDTSGGAPLPGGTATNKHNTGPLSRTNEELALEALSARERERAQRRAPPPSYRRAAAGTSLPPSFGGYEAGNGERNA